MRFLKLGLGLILFILTQVAYAQNCCCKIPCPKTKHWYVDLGLGWVINQHANDSLVPSGVPGFPNRYLVDDKQSTLLALVGLGYLWSFPCRTWIPYVSTGLEFDYLPSAKIAGVNEHFSTPTVTTSYEYRLTHYSLIAAGKMGIYRWGNWMPYVSLGLGSTWNRSDDFSETGSSSIPPGFGNKTQAEFTYNAGLGLDFTVKKDLWLSLGYRYDNFSNNSTGNGTLTSSTKQLSSRTHADTILLNLRYLFA